MRLEEKGATKCIRMKYNGRVLSRRRQMRVPREPHTDGRKYLTCVENLMRKRERSA